MPKKIHRKKRKTFSPNKGMSQNFLRILAVAIIAGIAIIVWANSSSSNRVPDATAGVVQTQDQFGIPQN